MKCFCLVINFGMFSIGGGDYECHKSSRHEQRSEILWKPHESITGRRSEQSLKVDNRR